MWRRSPRVLGALVVGVVVASLMAGESALPALAQTAQVSATVETDPVPSGGDADDPAIWVHPSDPQLSTIIGTDKEGGLAVHDLDGNQIQYVSGIQPNNVDIRHDFPLGSGLIDLVGSSDRANDEIAFHAVDPETRQLVAMGSFAPGIDIYGICLYHSPVSDSYHVFVTSEEAGPVGQFELSDDGSGGITGTEVRRFQMNSTSEGCVADDGLGYLYVTEEDVGVWKYDAEPDAGSNRLAVDGVGLNLEADVEGVTIYYGPEDTGYLIVSSQGSHDYAVYEREGDNSFLSKFEIVDSAAIDAASNTDGIDTISTGLGPSFPSGLFVVQDGDNDPEENNFKIVPWETIARSTNPVLIMETGWNPREENALDLPRAPLPALTTDPTSQPGASSPSPWSVAAASVTAAEDDGTVAADGSVDEGDAIVMAEGSPARLRFSNLEVPDGAMVRRAHITFTAAGESEGPVVLTISGAAQGTSVTWAPASWDDGDSGPYQQTPDLSRVIEEVMNQGWEPGDPITLEVSAAGAGRRSAVTFDGSPGAAPTLTLEYTMEG